MNQFPLMKCGSVKVCTMLALILMSSFVSAQSATVLYNDEVIEVSQTLADANDLWVIPEDLTRINGFVLKPQGACLDELCIPIIQDRDNDMLVTRSDQKWFNVTELANILQQSFVVDHATSTWSFGAMPLERRSFLNSAQAPDFELEDRNGNMVKLSDFRGKKVLLVTWASW